MTSCVGCAIWVPTTRVAPPERSTDPPMRLKANPLRTIIGIARMATSRQADETPTVRMTPGVTCGRSALRSIVLPSWRSVLGECLEVYGLSNGQLARANDGAVDASVVLIHLNNRLQHIRSG